MEIFLILHLTHSTLYLLRTTLLHVSQYMHINSSLFLQRGNSRKLLLVGLKELLCMYVTSRLKLTNGVHTQSIEISWNRKVTSNGWSNLKTWNGPMVCTDHSHTCFLHLTSQLPSLAHQPTKNIHVPHMFIPTFFFFLRKSIYSKQPLNFCGYENLPTYW